MTTATPTLQVHDLWAGYGARPAISGVAFQTRPGVTGLIGSNGAGKSTALKAVAGFMVAMRGGVHFGADSLAGLSPSAIVAKGLVTVPEGGGLFPSMSVEDNLLMGAYLPRARRQVGESLQRAFDLFPILAERRWVAARRLSGGEQQMLAIARALIALPRLLILDEPSLGLSPMLIETVRSAIGRIVAQGVDVLLCEQNAELALRISDFVYVMEHGQIVLEGSPQDLRNHPDVARAYLGG